MLYLSKRLVFFKCFSLDFPFDYLCVKGLKRFSIVLDRMWFHTGRDVSWVDWTASVWIRYLKKLPQVLIFITHL